METFVHMLLAEDFGRMFCDRHMLEYVLPSGIKVKPASWVQEEDVRSALCLC